MELVCTSWSPLQKYRQEMSHHQTFQIVLTCKSKPIITSQNEKIPHLVELPFDTVSLELLVGVITEHKGINGDHLTAQPTTLVPVQQSTSLLLHCTSYSSRAKVQCLSRGYWPCPYWQLILLCWECTVTMTFSCSNLHDMTHSIVETPKVRVQLPEWKAG